MNDIITNIAEGTVLSIGCSDSVKLGRPVREQGGFGYVYEGEYKNNDEEIPVAVKFLVFQDESDATDEMRSKEIARFKREIETLRRFSEFTNIVPYFYAEGEYEGRPFYVMERLIPVNLLEFDTNDKRLSYVEEVCSIVMFLHERGYVHYDIKPGNIMMREDAHGREYVLVDFGSVHKIETENTPPQWDPDLTVSMLSDGRRMYPHTPGYADPLEDRHTVNADIYSIGQVIRDTFPEDVPPAWSFVIDKCTSRNVDYRYKDVHSIICDLRSLKKNAYSFDVIEDIHIWQAQKKALEEDLVEMTWQELRWKLASEAGDIYSEEEDYPAHPGVFTQTREFLIDFGKLKNRNIRITNPVHMTESALLVIRGNGRISIDLDGAGISEIDVFSHAEMTGWDEPIYPFVILLDGASLDNRTKSDNEEAGVMYMVGRYCLLNFSSRNEAEEAEDSRFILKGRAGYSFVENGGRNWKNGLYGFLEDGNKRLFAQQKWDTLDLPSLLKTLRKIRSVNSQGDVHDWLENNVQNVLMRNLGRYMV